MVRTLSRLVNIDECQNEDKQKISNFFELTSFFDQTSDFS